MHVAVLGAGIQGCCLALELAARGAEVDIIDRNDRPFTQASLLNEAKLHLGFFYGNDPSLKTARLMAEGALNFLPLLRRWLGSAVDSLPVSRPYVYALHRDSLVSRAGLERHLAATSEIIRDLAGRAPDYCGIDPRTPPQRIDCLDGLVDGSQVVAAYETPEAGVSAAALADLVRSRLQAESRIRCLVNSTVTAATPRHDGVDVAFEQAGSCYTRRYDHAINALWDGRLQVDATAGIRYERPWLFRTRYNVHVPAGILPPLPSVSVVLGAFGDVVQYAGGETYLSWYPAGLRAITSGLQPAPYSSHLKGDAADAVLNATVEALSRLLPPLREVAALVRQHGEVKGGVIFARGETDITDPASELHSRYETGPASYGRYHTVDTGKFTLAPLFAHRLAESILHG
jgi:glycine/D-amino acid oxidase-like deaminating enzyme